MFRENFLPNRKAVSILLILIIAVFSFAFYRSVAKSQREHRIFCEDGLTSMMNKNDVLNYLQDFGDIDYSTSKTGDGEEEIYVGYRNKKITGEKTYVLLFNDGKYRKVRALPGFFDFQEAGTTVAVCQE